MEVDPRQQLRKVRRDVQKTSARGSLLSAKTPAASLEPTGDVVSEFAHAHGGSR